ncbi:type VI secretion system-associated protein TagF [Ideonella sp. DXS29W]|uniref:Type VI secretion system-associated protein TagF n=1 Tax=Ideonella lacteola TaxID=2984193 RepID=A0ABU9BVZ5_9BURK
MSRTSSVRPAYFGKLASRGDFIRSSHNGALLQMLDTWLTQGLELLSTDPQWKHFYDQTAATHFAFLSARSHQALAGHLVPSIDASGRRFPFVTTGAFEVEQPLAFMKHAPMALARLWARLESLAKQAHQAQDATAVLASAAQQQSSIEVAPEAYAASFRDFVELQTMGSLEALLKSMHPEVDLRRVLLGLGMLLQPVPASGKSQLDKGLRLPLPRDPLYAPMVGGLWLHLICPFLSRGDFELVIFVPGADVAASGEAPWLSIGFAGGAASTVQALFDPQKSQQAFITLSSPEWAEAQSHDDHAMKKLSSYLQQPQLSMAQALSTFGECFLGT